MSGLINRAFLAGSHNPSEYFKKYPRSTWTERGGYELQTTPDEAAAIVTHTKPYLKGHRMLCLGVQTLGTERFIAENTGILEIDVCNKDEGFDAVFERNRDTFDLFDFPVRVKDAPEGKYDLVTVYGSGAYNFDALAHHFKIGTFVVFIGTGVKNPSLRNYWMKMRKAHRAELQTGGAPYETGVGVAKILFVPAEDAKPEIKKEGENEIQKSNVDSNSDQMASASLGGVANAAPIPKSGVGNQGVEPNPPELGAGSQGTEANQLEHGGGLEKPKTKGWPKGMKRGPRKAKVEG